MGLILAFQSEICFRISIYISVIRLSRDLVIQNYFFLRSSNNWVFTVLNSWKDFCELHLLVGSLSVPFMQTAIGTDIFTAIFFFAARKIRWRWVRKCNDFSFRSSHYQIITGEKIAPAAFVTELTQLKMQIISRPEAENDRVINFRMSGRKKAHTWRKSRAPILQQLRTDLNAIMSM